MPNFFNNLMFMCLITYTIVSFIQNSSVKLLIVSIQTRMKTSIKPSYETVGQTNIINCKVSELNNQNINLLKSKQNYE